MNRRSVILTVAVVVAVHAVAITFYLARTNQLDAVLTALTPVHMGDRTTENAYTPPTPIKINKFTPSIVAPQVPTSDKVEIFSWVDESGMRRFSKSRSDFDVSSLSVLQGEPVYVGPDEGLPSHEGAKGRTVETKVFIENDRVFVPVKVCYHGTETAILMTFDTGATRTSLQTEIAQSLKIDDSVASRSRVADGSYVETSEATLDYIQVGPFRMKNHAVAIIPHHGDEEMSKGLLGMNFLKHVEYKIDFERRTIRWRL